jgi:hypothetical protein
MTMNARNAPTMSCAAFLALAPLYSPAVMYLLLLTLWLPALPPALSWLSVALPNAVHAEPSRRLSRLELCAWEAAKRVAWVLAGTVTLVVLSQTKLICVVAVRAWFERTFGQALPYRAAAARSLWNGSLHLALVLSELVLESIPQTALQVFNVFQLRAATPVFYASLALSLLLLVRTIYAAAYQVASGVEVVVTESVAAADSDASDAAPSTALAAARQRAASLARGRPVPELVRARSAPVLAGPALSSSEEQFDVEMS